MTTTDPFFTGDVTPEPVGSSLHPDRDPCKCGCGETPVSLTAVYMRGHHPRNGTGPKGPSRRTKARDAGAEKGKQIDRVAGLIGAFQLPATLLVIVGKQTSSKPLVADGVVLSSSAPGLSKALVDMADENPAIDRAINAVLTVGPYAELMGILIPLGLQLAANHGAAPANEMLGTATVDQVLDLAGLGAADGES